MQRLASKLVIAQERLSLLTTQVYISSRDGKACEETAKKLTSQGPGKCFAIPADLSKFDECVRLAGEIEKREGSEC